MQIKMFEVVDLEEVPVKLTERLNSANDELSLNLESLKDELDKKKISVAKTFKFVEEARTLLVKFDRVLQECGEVLNVYHDVVLQRETAFLEKQASLNEEQQDQVNVKQFDV